MSHFKRLCAVVIALSLACATAQPAQASTKTGDASQKESSATRQLKKLATDYYLTKARFDPLTPTYFGDNRFDDQLGLSISPAKRQQQVLAYRKFGERLRSIHSEQLGADERINYAILDYEIKAGLTALQFPDHLLPINQMGSMPIYLSQLADGTTSQPISTPRQYRAYLSRIRQLTPWIDQAIINMREGIKSGVVLPKALIVSALPQYQKLPSKKADSSLFYAAVNRFPENLTMPDRHALAAAYQAEIGKNLNPALARLAKFLEEEYLPAGLNTDGYGALPNGADWYNQRVARYTTTTLTPEQIHAIGLAEVARIQEQFAILGPKLGYAGPAAGLPKWVGEQPQFMPFKDGQEILAVYRKLDGVLAEKLPTLFTLVPKAPLELRLEPELTRATASDHYTGPSSDGKRPGVFWSVVNDATKYSKTRMTTLFLHEGRPGHHFQVALQVENSFPDFRRFGGNTAYMEGWALYAETLGKEMGLYEEHDQYFGHLNYELLRAARLVVDTGLHAKGWTRERAIQYLRDINGFSEAVAKSAVERYMAWPGQALGYKVGALKIAELRARAASALGEKFSLPAFHAVVLGDGTVPLAVLEQSVDRWIATSR
jgi:uncharacterized protein (DUF885 family)